MPARRKDPPAMSADDFRGFMEARGLTLKEAGAVLGLSLSAVGRMARGESPITAETAALIRERLQGEKPGGPTG